MQKIILIAAGLALFLTNEVGAADDSAPLPLKRPAPRRSEYDDSILQAMDHGPFYYGSVHGKTVALKGVAIKLALGQAGVSFDTELLRMADGWTGGYLQVKGERTTGGHPQIGGKDSFFIGPAQVRGAADDTEARMMEVARQLGAVVLG